MASFRAAQERKAAPATVGVGAIDMALVVLFMAGLYTQYAIQISANLPLPSAPSGVAGLLLLWRRREAISVNSLIAFFCLMTIYVASILLAPNVAFLPKRFNGLVQLTYSLVVGYGLFLTLVRASRRQVAGLFLGATLLILVGCLLEVHGGLRPVSDAVRAALYPTARMYEDDLRDVLLYKRIRPKFLASEPSSVTFSFALFAFVWFTVSTWRYKLVTYVMLFAVGLFAMPGPTLLLMVLMGLPYLLFLASRRDGRLNARRFLQVAVLAVLLGVGFGLLAKEAFPTRFEQATGGDDPSFFYRVQGPAIVGIDSILNSPTGAGLTSEQFLESRMLELYAHSPAYSSGWEAVKSARELLHNYFWQHWIYLGAFFGVLVIVAISLWLRALDVPSPAFCWFVWAIMGQAAGAYVGPSCWAVLFLAGAAAVIHQRRPEVEPKEEANEEDMVLLLTNPLPGRRLAPLATPGGR